MSELGNKLRDARIDKGYTLNTLQQKTKIQKKYLQAIEDGQFQEMPGNFYVRAFVKQYADMVGLNGDQLLLDYEDELNEPAESAPVVETTQLPSRVKRHQQAEKSQLDQWLNYIPMLLLIGLILLIIGTLIYAIQSIGNEGNESVDVVKNQSVVSVLEPDSISLTDQTKENESKKEGTTETKLNENQLRVGKQVITLISEPTDETIYQMENPVDQYEFEVKADAFVWVGIYTDDVLQIDTPISAGETVKYTAPAGTQTVRVRLGYPEGGKIYVNGKQVEPKSDYIKETILFVLGEDAANNTTIPLDIPTNNQESNPDAIDTENINGETGAEGYQGPAVYDPNNGN